MTRTREQVASVLRRNGLVDLANEVERELPERIEDDDLRRFMDGHGVTPDWLADRKGGNP